MAIGHRDIIVLANAVAELQVAPSLGGGIVRYRAHGFDWLRPATPEALTDGRAEGLACFPLVPYSNRIRDGNFAFEGSRISLAAREPHALHGHGWRGAWTVAERSSARLVIEYRHMADDWPFDYRARQTFALSDDALTVTIELANEGEAPMPCGLGLHPYLPRTVGGTITADVDAMWESDADLLPLRLISPPPSDFDPGRGVRPEAVALDTVFVGWSREATVEWPDRGRRLAIFASPPLDFLVIYTPPDADYFCLEPVSHCTDAFNLAATGRTDTGMLVLPPGETVRATVAFRPA